MIKVVVMVRKTPRQSNWPRLAVPRWERNMSVPKLDIVVSPLKRTPLAVLV